MTDWRPRALLAVLLLAGLLAPAQARKGRIDASEALRAAPAPQRRGLEFILENMPRRDREGLSTEFLLENVALAYEALDQAPWGKTIPEDIFLNEILPYAALSERRDDWRKTLREKCLPLVKDSKTPSEAAHRLNQTLFDLVKVRYSTQRKKPDQSPLESMELGLASCSGLAILLVDACRSVGIPARLAGTPNWIDHAGNHTWVEIWDQGWRFAGAAEPSPEGLDHAWFVPMAAQALKDVPEHAIYAASFKKTGLAFPLNWVKGENPVSAVNVTDRYRAAAAPAALDRTRLLVDVRERGTRVAARVLVDDAGPPPLRLEGTAKDGRSDTNDILAFELPRERTYDLTIEYKGKILRRRYRSVGERDRLELELPESAPLAR